MPTAYITHPDCRRHEMGIWHPESPKRLAAVSDQLRATGTFAKLDHYEAPLARRHQLLLAHSERYLAALEATAPTSGYRALDPDTTLNPYTLDAAYRAAGGAAYAVDLVMQGAATNAFVACRPPGHHATRDRAMGFCIFNNVAVAALHALAAHGLERVAIVDFDVHHGNGTEDIVQDDPRVLLCSTFQHPLYPFQGDAETSANIVNVPLLAGTDSLTYREAFSAKVTSALEAFSPQFVFCSAGFDGHIDEGIAEFELGDSDYAWITDQIMAVAARHANGRLVSVLEGGYNLDSLGRAAAAHIWRLTARLPTISGA